ncbi:FGLLP motif-containing membrane protein [Actinoplanes sp. CA-131856]
MPTLERLTLSGPVLALTAALAALLVILIAFPAEVFNKTFERNKNEIHGALEALGVRRPGPLPTWIQAGLLVVTAALLALAFSGDEGPATVKIPDGGLVAQGQSLAAQSGNMLAQAVALLVAIPLVMTAYAGPGEIYLRRKRGAAVLRVPMVALGVALVCALGSHLLDLKPSYTYGMFAMFVLVGVERREPPRGQSARAVLWSVCGLGLLVGAAYLGYTGSWGPSHTGQAGWLPVLGNAIAFWVVVLGAETLVFALMPVRFLDGRAIASWCLSLWTGLQFLAAWFFWIVIQGRAAANPQDVDDHQILKALCLFLAFGVASGLFWGYFRWSGRPTAGLGDGGPQPPARLTRPPAAVRRYRREAVQAWQAVGHATAWASSVIKANTRKVGRSLRTAALRAYDQRVTTQRAPE